MQHHARTDLLEDRTVWVITVPNDFGDGQTLLISKVSEAVNPAQEGNHVGEGAHMDAFIVAQPGVRFIINGGFSHYRKNFYDWPHQNFNVGDPVGLVKIRDHYYEDLHDIQNYGFFVQDDKGKPWRIVRQDALQKTEKYILGCTPLLIFDGAALPLPTSTMTPLPAGTITPPSILAHGLQCHPRTAIGIKGGDIFFVIVEGDDDTGGCTLAELQTLGTALGMESFLNLDGGGSSQFRLRQDDGYIRNAIAPKDQQRVLGHVIVLFDDKLKSGTAA